MIPDAYAEALSANYSTFLKAHDHPPDVEAAISVACKYSVAVNAALVKYLRGSDKPGTAAKMGTPGRETRSPGWNRAEAVYFASITTLAAVLGVRHPSPTGFDPVQETGRLIADRVGPLCNGWSSNGSTVIDTHHPALDCPVHPRKDTP